MTTLRWAIRVLYAEAVAVALVTGLLLYLAATQKAVSAGTAVTVVVVAAGLAALLGLLARLLQRHRAGARAPAIVLQLLFLPIGYSMPVWVGVPLMAAGLACAVLLLAPSTRQALGIR